MVDHLKDRTRNAFRIHGEQTQHHKAEVADRGISNQFLDIFLRWSVSAEGKKKGTFINGLPDMPEFLVHVPDLAKTSRVVGVTQLRKRRRKEQRKTDAEAGARRTG